MPGKLTGKKFWEEKTRTLWREFAFEEFLPYKKPEDTVTLRFSLRGGYSPYAIFGHGEFKQEKRTEVATGWVPLGGGHFRVFPDQSKKHLPKWIPERTQLIRVPLIKQYGKNEVNAYDIALGLDRVNKGEEKPIPFQLTPTTAEDGRQGVRLSPTQPLTEGVYYAYSLPDDTEKYHGLVHGFLFAVEAANLVATTTSGDVGGPDFKLRAYREDNPFWISGNAPASMDPPNPQLGNALGNCTWYANGRLREIGYSKDDLDKLISDASKWDDIARANGIPISDIPIVGSVAQTDIGANGMGHVAVVERLNADGSITVSESSYAGNNPSAESTWNFVYRLRTNAPSWFNCFIQVRRTSASIAPADDSIVRSATVDAQLAKEILDYALLSQAIYDQGTAKFKVPDGWGVSNPRSLSSPLDLKDTAFTNLGNGFKAGVFVKGKTLVVVFEGTTGSFPFGKDWRTDVLAFIGANPKQYQTATDYVGRIIALAGRDFDIVLTGHSLGGGLASYAALRHGTNAIVFNAAGIGNGLRAAVSENLERQHLLIRSVNLVGDPVSALGKQVGAIYTLNVPNGFTWRDDFGTPLLGTLGIVSSHSGSTPLLTDSDITVLKAHHSMQNVIAALDALIKPNPLAFPH